MTKGMKDLSCSVIVPCLNEVDNIEECVARIPRMGRFTEIIFVDGHSTDGTVEKIKELMRHRDDIRLLIQTGKGKGQAVRMGFQAASGDILMILDADLSVSPEELPRFFNSLAQGKADFANGSRLLYPMEKGAMGTLNFLGNKVFSLLFSWLLKQRIRDTLCGTKALFKRDFLKMKLGDDPWGDFQLLIWAAKTNLKIVDVPVRYKRRAAGISKMRPFKHGWEMFIVFLRGIRELRLC